MKLIFGLMVTLFFSGSVFAACSASSLGDCAEKDCAGLGAGFAWVNNACTARAAAPVGATQVSTNVPCQNIDNSGRAPVIKPGEKAPEASATGATGVNH